MIHRNESSGTPVVGQLTCLTSVSCVGRVATKTTDDKWPTADSPGSFCGGVWFRGILGSHLFAGGNWLAPGLSPNIVRRSPILGELQASRGHQRVSRKPAQREFPESLLNVEVLREAATMAMLTTVALLAGVGITERFAIFLWTFAIWDLAYYAGLWATVRWPSSLKDMDVLFLIPVPWISQVWFPILVSILSLIAVLAAWKQHSPVRAGSSIEKP